MDLQFFAFAIILIIMIVSIGLFSFVIAFMLGGIADAYFYKKRSERFNSDLVKLLEQNLSTKDIVDLYKSIFNISDKNEPTFVSKIIISLEDFKTWKLEMEIKTSSDESIHSHPTEWRSIVNKTIDEINMKYPFADLKAENKIFFEDFKKFIENREFEACQSKLVELSKIFAGQNKDLEKMAKKTTYSYYLSIVGAVIGFCGIILPYLFR